MDSQSYVTKHSVVKFHIHTQKLFVCCKNKTTLCLEPIHVVDKYTARSYSWNQPTWLSNSHAKIWLKRNPLIRNVGKSVSRDISKVAAECNRCQRWPPHVFCKVETSAQRETCLTTARPSSRVRIMQMLLDASKCLSGCRSSSLEATRTLIDAT